MLFWDNLRRNAEKFALGGTYQNMMASVGRKCQIVLAKLIAFFSFIIISFVLVQSASAQTTPRPDFVLPATCGAFEREGFEFTRGQICLLYTSPSPRDKRQSRMPSSA